MIRKVPMIHITTIYSILVQQLMKWLSSQFRRSMGLSYIAMHSNIPFLYSIPLILNIYTVINFNNGACQSMASSCICM